jgi:hypothetical protein
MDVKGDKRIAIALVRKTDYNSSTMGSLPDTCHVWSFSHAFKWHKLLQSQEMSRDVSAYPFDARDVLCETKIFKAIKYLKYFVIML